jgi:hypothetical protein
MKLFSLQHEEELERKRKEEEERQRKLEEERRLRGIEKKEKGLTIEMMRDMKITFI